PGLPDAVAALVTALDRQSVTLELVNLDPLAPREVLLQAGAFGEHQFTCCRLTPPGIPAPAEEASSCTEVNARHLQARLEPAGSMRLQIELQRDAHRPSYARPWDGAP